MAGLQVAGDADGWIDVGYSIGALAARLDAELSDADQLGAAALARSWYGPAADGFQVAWSARRAQCQDLIELATRASRAITAYGQALHAVQQRARFLEYSWCTAGLMLAPGGIFAVPAAIALASPVRTSLERMLPEALRDAAGVDAEVLVATNELLITLDPVIGLLEEFGLAIFGSDFTREAAHDFVEGAGDWLPKSLHAAAKMAERIADSPELIGSERAAKWFVDHEDHVARWLPIGAGVIAAIPFAQEGWDVFRDARKEGPLASIEQNAGGIASTVTDVLIVDAAIDAVGLAVVAVTGTALAAAPVAVVAGVVIGGVVLAGAVAAGVGWTVQTIVNHRQAIGHFVETTGHDVKGAAEAGARDVATGVRDIKDIF